MLRIVEGVKLFFYRRRYETAAVRLILSKEFKNLSKFSELHYIHEKARRALISTMDESGQSQNCDMFFVV